MKKLIHVPMGNNSVKKIVGSKKILILLVEKLWLEHFHIVKKAQSSIIIYHKMLQLLFIIILNNVRNQYLKQQLLSFLSLREIHGSIL